MHLVDGIVSTPVLVVGSVAAVAGIGLGLRQLTPERIPAAAMLGSVFFVASLIHVPLGPSSVHLILGGLAAIMLGWAAFPALFVAVLLQAVFFGFGGVTVVGVNTVVLAGPAVLCGLVARRFGHHHPALWGAGVGALSIIASALLCSLVLALSGEGFIPMAKALVWAHVPVALIEAVVTSAAVAFLAKVRPTALSFAGMPFCEGSGS